MHDSFYVFLKRRIFLYPASWYRGRAIWCIMFAACGCMAQQRADYATFLKKSTAIHALQYSPDGKYLMYAIAKVDWENNRRHTAHMLYNLQDKTQQALLPEESSVVQPTWSPSGKSLAFIAPSHSTGISLPQLFVQEWPEGKPVCVTTSPTGVSTFRWAPNEEAILYLAKDAAAVPQGTERFIQAFEVGNNGYTTTSQPMPYHLYRIHLPDKSVQKLTMGNWTVRDFNWSSDSTAFLLRAGSAYSGDSYDMEALSLHVPSGKTEVVAKEFSYPLDAKISPGKERVALSYKKNNTPSLIAEIAVFTLQNPVPKVVTARIDRSISAFDWMPDGQSLLLLTASGVRTGLEEIGMDGESRAVPLPSAITSVSEFAIHPEGLIAMVAGTPRSSAEIYLYDPVSSKTERISSYNTFIDSLWLGKSEGMEWPVGNGMYADGVVTYPPDFEEGKKYPLVLFIHGGPTAASNLTILPFVQQLAAQGWIVFQPNYRGSSNKGNRFQRAIEGDAGKGPGKDIMKGIKALKERGIVDDARIAVSGWSYGGFMTAWLIGKYPDFWKAAVAGAAPVDITDMTSLTDLNVSVRHAITSSPWEQGELRRYLRMSPIANLPKAKAPTLVLSVVSDERVSVTGSYKIYHALKANKIPTQFFAYPGTAHFPADPINANDVYRRWTEWLETHLR